jgi:hypothetical protein
MKLPIPALLVAFGLLAAACDAPKVTSTKGTGGGAGGAAGGAGAPGGSGGSAPPPDFVLPPPPDGGYPEGGPTGSLGEGPQCAQHVEKAKLTPVDLLLLMDASGSMAEKAGARSRWEMARDAVAAFLQDSRSTGLGVGMQLFPVKPKPCEDDGDCFLPAPGGCQIFSACVPTGGDSLAPGKVCGIPDDDPCPAGTTCTMLGRCSVSGGDCANPGKLCPSGVANDMCGPRPRQCRFGPRSGGSCEAADYNGATGSVPMGDLPMMAARLIGAMDTRLAIGSTPLPSALKGAMAQLLARQQANNGRRAALVIVTDGVPEGCPQANTVVADLQAAAARNPSISTYVVGVFGGNELPAVRATIDSYAMAGGTGMPFIITANDQLTEKFLAALNQIRGAALSCDVAIPAPSGGQIDFGKVNVHVDGTGGPVDLVYVESRDRCAMAMNGWYYDVNPAMSSPMRVQLCPGVCERLKADPKGSIELRFGCKTRIIE